MPTEPDGADLVFEARIAASPETVFGFFTDPERAVLWMGDQATLDPRAGGIYRVGVREQFTARGSYVEVDPPRRVVFTWGWEQGMPTVPPGSTTVEVDLEPDGDGTLLRLTHSGLPPQMRPPHAAGWTHYVARLEIAAPGGDPGPDLGPGNEDELGS